jgi:hypothetical protein
LTRTSGIPEQDHALHALFIDDEQNGSGGGRIDGSRRGRTALLRSMPCCHRSGYRYSEGSGGHERAL